MRQLVAEDSCRTVRELALLSRVSIGSCHKILREDLRVKKVAAHYVLKILTTDQCLHRMQVCQRNLDRLAQEPFLLRHVISGDESWVYSFDPVWKHQAASWVGCNDPRPETALQPQSQKNVMLTVFFDDAGVLHHEFTTRTVNRYTYRRILRRLREKICKRRPGLWTPGFGHAHCVLLHHDNAPAHKALHTRTRLNKTGIKLLEQPPYSPDLATVDFFLFPHLKQVLHGVHFWNVEELKDRVSMVLKSIPSEEFAQAFQDMKKQWQKCVLHEGRYFEGMRHLRPDNPLVAQ